MCDQWTHKLFEYEIQVFGFWATPNCDHSVFEPYFSAPETGFLLSICLLYAALNLFY